MTLPRPPRERGIVFSTPMVCALLAGSKSQTRRAIKPTNLASARRLGSASPCCPYRPGDRLWVREGWYVDTRADGRRPSELEGQDTRFIWYAADAEASSPPGARRGRYRHARFMPRWASRIVLEVAATHAEPLPDCSADDAIAEGLLAVPGGWQGAPDLPVSADPIQAYRALWEHINGSGSWSADSWVWVVEFRVVTA